MWDKELRALIDYSSVKLKLMSKEFGLRKKLESQIGWAGSALVRNWFVRCGAGHMVTSSTRRQQICKVILQPGGLHGGRGLSGPHEKLIGQLPFKEVSADAAHILPAPAKSTGILPGGQTWWLSKAADQTWEYSSPWNVSANIKFALRKASSAQSVYKEMNWGQAAHSLGSAFGITPAATTVLSI